MIPGLAKPANPQQAPFTEITFSDGGSTSNPLRFWSGDTMIDLERLQALKMTVKGKSPFGEARRSGCSPAEPYPAGDTR